MCEEGRETKRGRGLRSRRFVALELEVWLLVEENSWEVFVCLEEEEEVAAAEAVGSCISNKTLLCAMAGVVLCLQPRSRFYNG